jgi:hypothetical protein
MPQVFDSTHTRGTALRIQAMNPSSIRRKRRHCLAPTSIRATFILLSIIPAACTKPAETAPAPAVMPTTSSPNPVLETGDPGSIQPNELKTLLEGVPDTFRKNRSDLDLARDLGIHAWAIEYTGGPLTCWLDIEETGQSTIPARYPGPVGMDFPAKAERGRIMIGLRPGAARGNPSGRSKRILQELGNPVDGIGESFIISGALHSRESSANPRVPKLWAAWNDVAFKELSCKEKVEGDGDVTLLAVEATEKQPPPGALPRKLTYALRAKAVPAPKP